MKQKLKAAVVLICLLSAAICVFYQFKFNNLLPLLISAAFIVPVRWLKPSWFNFAWLLPVGGAVLLLIDAFGLRHRIAVEARTWTPLWDTAGIEDISASPSGRSTVYIIGDHWLDSFYSVYISSGTLFPVRGHSGDWGENERYIKGASAGWDKNVFTFGEPAPGFAFDESTGKSYSSVLGATPFNSGKEDFTRLIQSLKMK